MSEYKDKYWNTLIQLSEAEDKNKFKGICDKLDVSASKVIGNMIHSFVMAHEAKQRKTNDE